MKLKTIIINAYERLDTLLEAARWVFIITVATMCLLGFRTTLTLGRSMQPTIADGSLTLLKTSGYTLSRGDIVAFRCDTLDKYLIKRVIGLPGDTIEFLGNEVYRNGKRLNEPYAVADYFNFGDALQTYHVGEGHLFVLGDNRPISCDSRYDAVGQVNTNDVIGVCVGWKLLPKPVLTAVRQTAKAIRAMTDKENFQNAARTP